MAYLPLKKVTAAKTPRNFIPITRSGTGGGGGSTPPPTQGYIWPRKAK